MGKTLREMLVFGALGVVLRPLDHLVPKDPRRWVFGALDGERFVDNSKHLFLFALERDSGREKICWITRNASVIEELASRRLPCESNFSLRGLWTILRAGNLVISTRRSDVLYFFRHGARRVFHLHHGMPVKRLDPPPGRHRRLPESPLLDALWTHFAAGFRWSEVDAIVVTSDYYRAALATAFRNPRVFVTGQPRTDVLVGDDQSRSWSRPQLDAIRRRLGITARFVVSYLPTHRSFGAGPQPVAPFLHDPIALGQLRQAGVQIAVKMHPEAIARTRWPASADGVLLDVSRSCEDPQDLLRVTDCLVTDFSSVFVDFLLLDRPLIFYLYDEDHYVAQDNGVYFDLREKRLGPAVTTEAELLREVLSAATGEDPWAASRRQQMAFFHAFPDGKACERVWAVITGVRSARSAGGDGG